MGECACVLQYAQSCFEGLKAYTTADGKIVCFRPDLNATRMVESAERLKMPPFPAERFLDAIKQVVKANAAWVPPYGSGASLYIRPYMFGFDSVIGVKPAQVYQFRTFVTPVGPYFKGGVRPLNLRISDYDRAAFTIASYNCGASRVLDARHLAEYYDEPHNEWATVQEYMKLLSDEEFYNHEAVVYGRFKEPDVTIYYTNSVLSRYSQYLHL